MYSSIELVKYILTVMCHHRFPKHENINISRWLQENNCNYVLFQIVAMTMKGSLEFLFITEVIKETTNLKKWIHYTSTIGVNHWIELFNTILPFS